MQATLAEMIERSAALAEAINQQYAPCQNKGTRARRSNTSCTRGDARRQCTPYACRCPRPFADEAAIDAALDLDGHFYEVEISVLESGTPDNGKWHAIYYATDLELEDLAEEWTEEANWRWGLADEDWDGTLQEAARLMAETTSEPGDDELRPWRVRVWDYNSNGHEPAVAWGLTPADARAMQDAVALAESEIPGEWDITDIIGMDA